jgi:hypothetical protein
MANMSYCRFENTLSDLGDCADNLYPEDEGREPLEGREARCRDHLIKLCRRIVEDADDHAADREAGEELGS